MRDTITVTADQLEAFAFESGKTITIRPDRAELRVGTRLFVAPLACGTHVPVQRSAGEES